MKELRIRLNACNDTCPYRVCRYGKAGCMVKDAPLKLEYVYGEFPEFCPIPDAEEERSEEIKVPEKYIILSREGLCWTGDSWTWDFEGVREYKHHAECPHLITGAGDEKLALRIVDGMYVYVHLNAPVNEIYATLEEI